ncbi:MAG: oligopeptide ABC transporter ATP-binding protein [Thermoproteota archaeon]|nr:MAG: oligopeptide ABC transporter ATP-binding protein [Candidatus Korarchaeota archaeon]
MTQKVLEVRNLKKWFPVRTGILASLLGREQKYVKAVDGIDFEIDEGEVLCLVGESGCGKTTTARTVLRLIEPTDGKIIYRGMDLTQVDRQQLRTLRSKIQMIFQNPFEVLDPRMSVMSLVGEGLEVNDLVASEQELRERVFDALEKVRLIPAEDFARRFPHELSGGQLQRVAIARALVLGPDFIVADEPVSMLDASIRIEIINLMMELKKTLNLTYLYITHDIAQARYIGDKIGIMYLGKIVEQGPMEEVIREPLHPYTEALISNVPVPDPTVKRRRILLRGETPTPVDLPKGCRFRPRCPYVKDICKEKEPELIKGNERTVMCHLVEK